ncbi:protein phosphatase 2C domain-containing protein [Mycolicibacterium austroafricanum]|nr:protein phosphatase 2C domain-containing protein [Mycolicibacterium austroafricanum]QZT71231.1 protein phosphatase 2C domain-containing protein [Mycolicibacterium austroafricanum]
MTVAGAAVEPPGNWQWAACAASETGAEHERRGLGCDDAYSYGTTGDFIVAAVADGAGSVSGTSAWGAHVACQAVLEHAMLPDFIRDFHAASADEGAQVRWLFDRALERVRAQASQSGLNLALLSTTLAVGLADRRRAAFGQIGDGVVAVELGVGDERRIATLLAETKREYANSTWFLQSDRAFEESFRTVVVDGVTAFALSTDGMAYKITNVATGEPYEPFFRGSWEHVRSGASAAHFAALLRGIQDDQTGDDKTMVLAAMRWEEDLFYPSARPLCRTLVSSPVPASTLAPTKFHAATARPEAESGQIPVENSGRLRRLFGSRGRRP